MPYARLLLTNVTTDTLTQAVPNVTTYPVYCTNHQSLILLLLCLTEMLVLSRAIKKTFWRVYIGDGL